MIGHPQGVVRKIHVRGPQVEEGLDVQRPVYVQCAHHAAGDGAHGVRTALGLLAKAAPLEHAGWDYRRLGGGTADGQLDGRWRENEIAPTVIELNLETVRRLRESGVTAIYGDASHVDTLKAAGVDRAGSLILSASGTHGSAEVIRQARELNPEIRVLARSTYVHEMPSLRRAGAEAVFSGEAEIALAVTEAVLERLGATPEQIESILAEGGMRIERSRGKWVLNRKLLNRIPLFAGRLAARIDRGLLDCNPRRAWDVFVEAKKEGP